jgi:hypothetical protein
MEQHVFTLALIIEGTTEKVLQFIMSKKSIYVKNFSFLDQKYCFKHNVQAFLIS